MNESATGSVKLSTNDFERLSEFIYKECGINLSAPKKILLESRLQKRLGLLKFLSFSEYCNYVMSHAGIQDELVHMIDAVATNKTDFFREPVHFQFMEQQALPEFLSSENSRTYKVWSAACSTGEEPYTIAMVLEELVIKNKFDYSITATDISSKVLQKAITAIYPERIISDVPMSLRKKYMLRSKDKESPTIRMIEGLRKKVHFKRLNLMDDALDVDNQYDLIFCRNVLIYFDRPTQEQVIRKLLKHLRPGGYLFIGHSESIYHMDITVKQIRPTIFQKL